MTYFNPKKVSKVLIFVFAAPPPSPPSSTVPDVLMMFCLTFKLQASLGFLVTLVYSLINHFCSQCIWFMSD